jgi:hypothetical protein
LWALRVQPFLFDRSKVENDFLAPKIAEGSSTDDRNPEIVRNEDRNSPDSPDSAGSTGSVSIPGSVVAGGFIETPVYTFTLPDLTCYQGYYTIHLLLISLSFFLSAILSTNIFFYVEYSCHSATVVGLIQLFKKHSSLKFASDRNKQSYSECPKPEFFKLFSL